MRTSNSRSRPAIPIRASEILDPYPERARSLGGVRQPTHLAAVPDLVELQTPAAPAPAPFAASVPTVTTVYRRPLLPIASTVATILGQAALGALMATRTVDPALGLLIFVGWLTCGIGLIFAQCLQLAGTRK